MRKIVAGFAISLDGYIAGPDNEYDWIIVDPEIDFAEQMKRYDAYFLGRKTYELSSNMGGSFGKSKVYIFSETLEKAGEPFILVKGDVAGKVTEIKNEPGKDIALFGGGELLTSFLNMDLVDELSLAVIPVMLGKGIPFIRELQKRTQLALINTKSYSNGTVQLSYNIIKEKRK